MATARMRRNVELFIMNIMKARGAVEKVSKGFKSWLLDLVSIPTAEWLQIYKRKGSLRIIDDGQQP